MVARNALIQTTILVKLRVQFVILERNTSATRRSNKGNQLFNSQNYYVYNLEIEISLRKNLNRKSFWLLKQFEDLETLLVKFLWV